MSTLNPERIRQHLTKFDFTPLFVEELGWERPRGGAAVVGGVAAREVARLGGIPALEIVRDDIPDSAERRAIHAAISKVAHENLLIFVDEDKTRQLWSWVKREGGKSVLREHPFVKGQPGDLFLSKLAGLFVDIGEYDEQGNLSILQAGQKLKSALDVSKVTKKFYGDFKGVHLDLVGMLGGIPTDAEKRWYASVLLNRLMFVYFLQKKGFLDGGDYDYLENRFAAHQTGNIYKDFLEPLFFKAFALPDGHAEKIAARGVVGKIPYLNGGLFLPHALESYPITLRNDGPNGILKLFKSVTWYLNDVPGSDDNAMSPDVLGYIFEKYINDQKSAGAYYTPPEITEYLCERTVHDLLVERVSLWKNGKIKKFDSISDILLHLDGELCRVVLGQLEGLRLLDPAVGSGAFLVAALKTLTNIYGALWGRAEVLNDPDLKLMLIGDTQRHQSPFYAIRKRIITQNLFGVDIMAEATEIARVRLFLSLVASAKTVHELEPLPNIDFNILEGNSLIGLTAVDEDEFGKVRQFALFDGPLKTYRQLVDEKEAGIERYKGAVPAHGETPLGIRQHVEEMRKGAERVMNALLLADFNALKIQYAGPDGKRKLAAADLEALEPFHWGYEFSKAIESGGFDCSITNPPWEIWKPNAKEFFQTFSEVVTKKR